MALGAALSDGVPPGFWLYVLPVRRLSERAPAAGGKNYGLDAAPFLRAITMVDSRGHTLASISRSSSDGFTPYWQAAG